MNVDAALTWAEGLFLAVFFFLYFGVPALLAWVSYSERSMCKSVDIRALWMQNERPDKLAVIILGTWWVHTCSMILWSLKNTVTTTDYLTYMGWALPIIANMWLVPKPGTVVSSRVSEPAADPATMKTTDTRTETPPIAGAKP